jgi:uncharacterized membrane protein
MDLPAILVLAFMGFAFLVIGFTVILSNAIVGGAAIFVGVLVLLAVFWSIKENL